MRMTQFVGLNKRAEAYLDKYCSKEPALLCPHCNGVVRARPKANAYKEIFGMFEELAGHLHEYELIGGGIVREVVQAEPWSGGPVIFLCLEKDGRQFCRWPQKDIDNC